MFDWIRQHESVLLALGVFSAIGFVFSLIAVPMLIARLPRDYFAHTRRVPPKSPHHPALRLTVLVMKNVLGGVLLLAGVAMLVLPGQGILTILIGLFLMNFPGKFALERHLVRQRPVWGALNWIRQKAGRPPLLGGPDETVA